MKGDKRSVAEEKKKSFIDKLAEKAFQSARVQENWKAHVYAFGPILEPAFVDNPKARLELTAALNAISQRKIAQGFKKLQGLRNACVTKEDKTAWLFCAGMCFDIEGNTSKMMSFYTAANENDHKFYLPYVQVGKVAHQGAFFDDAEYNYRKAIDCLGNAVWNTKMQPVVASVYTNLGSCLTMMHRYEEASEQFLFSRRIMPEQPGREASEAILYAALKDEERVKECLELLERNIPAMYEDAKKMTGEIIADKHAHFSEQPVDVEKMLEFWEKFSEKETWLREKIAEKKHEEVIDWLSKQLDPLFPFAERSLDFGILTEKEVHRLELADFYAVGLQKGYETLFRLRPKELDEHWQFAIVH